MASRKQRGWTVPGFGLPLRWPEMQSRVWQPLFQPDENTLLLSVLDASENPTFCYTMREIKMLAWINSLTDMDDWDRKIFDPDFVFDWKSAKVMTGYDVTRSMADWCAEEVKYYVQDFISTRIIPALDGGVIKSNDCIDLALRKDLQSATAALRKHSSEQVVDLIDPYLYPYAWMRTRTLGRGSVALADSVSRCGEGDPVKFPPQGDCVQDGRSTYPNDMAWSRRFQWLPFDVTFEGRGEGPSRIASYINNVHPILHSPIYKVTEKLIDILIPLFNRTLIDLKAPGYRNQRIHLAELGRDLFINREPYPFRPPEQRSYDKYLDAQKRYQDFIFVDLKKEFWNAGVQMVMQLQDVNLSPDNPEYDGQEWHVHGQNNERIAATALYVYSTTNVSTPSPPFLSFRRCVRPEESILAKGYIRSPPFLPEIYGAKDGDPAIQEIGNVVLREGRVVMWPNTFQVRLKPFGLADRKKTGHVGILMLHLIDPNRRIMSTGMIPCQRRDWWADEIRRTCARFWRLPKDVFERIVEEVDYPISIEEAEKMREEFVEEREEYRKKHTKTMKEYLQWDFVGEPGVGDGDGDGDDE